MTKKYTSIDIAQHAGVSQSTVSRALSNNPMVSEETRLKVQAIASKLNYHVDKNASNLRSQHTNTIALLIFEGPTNDEALINPFFSSMLGHITKHCSTKGFDLLISFQQLEDDWHADFEGSKKVDGIILLGYGNYLDYENKLLHLINQDTHFVSWGVASTELPIISVGCNNFDSGYQITKHLLDIGRKKIVFLGSTSKQSPEFLQRYTGYRKALGDQKIIIDSKLQIDTTSTEASGFNSIKYLLRNKIKFDAIFAASDSIAIGAMWALNESGLSIPEDVAVVGFDDIPGAKFSNPPLTTAKQNIKVSSELLVDKLISLIHNEKVSSQFIPTELIIRKSCGS